MQLSIGSIGTFTLVSFQATTTNGIPRTPASCGAVPPPSPPPATDCDVCGDGSFAASAGGGKKSKKAKLTTLTFGWSADVDGTPGLIVVAPSKVSCYVTPPHTWIALNGSINSTFRLAPNFFLQAAPNSR
jgi:hypothetical protein